MGLNYWTLAVILLPPRQHCLLSGTGSWVIVVNVDLVTWSTLCFVILAEVTRVLPSHQSETSSQPDEQVDRRTERWKRALDPPTLTWKIVLIASRIRWWREISSDEVIWIYEILFCLLTTEAAMVKLQTKQWRLSSIISFTVLFNWRSLGFKTCSWLIYWF